MEYMILIYGDESWQANGPQPGSPEFDEMMTGWLTYNQRLVDGGHFVAGANLTPTATATTVRKTFDAEPLVSDGPFAETKEQLGGFYLVQAADLDEAIELAKVLPVPVGSIEVRPVAFRPQG